MISAQYFIKNELFLAEIMDEEERWELLTTEHF